jgi:hypothetical protein
MRGHVWTTIHALPADILWRERIRNRLRVAGDDREIGACSLVWLPARCLTPL